MPTEISALAQEVAQLRHMVQQLAKGSRYAHGGSIENAALQVRDDAGSLRTILGVQGDGTVGVNVVNGPVPPAPAAPSVEPALAALAITWDGTFTGVQAAPLDWQRVEVHIGPNPNFVPDQGTLRGTLESPQGGTVTVPLPYTQWYVKLRSRTTSGVASAATDTVAATPRKADTQDLTAGAVTADTIAVDALTGKTITGGTMTGALVQTAASGQRITLNEANANKILVYNSAGTAIGELSDRGLLVKGTGGAVLHLDPNNTYPNLRMTNAALTNAATINVVETTPGAADLGLNSGTFAGSGFTDMKWRHFMGNDFAVIERFRELNPSTVIGGRLNLRNNSASLSYTNSDDASQYADLVIDPGLARTRARAVIQPFQGNSSTLLFLQPGPSHTGPILRYWDPDASRYRFTIDKAGNADIDGVLTAGNIATGTTTITPSAAHVPTSASVNFPALKGTTFRGYATAATTVPGVRTPVGAQGVTGVGVSAVTSTGMLVWANRENTTATVVNWMVIAS